MHTHLLRCRKNPASPRSLPLRCRMWQYPVWHKWLRFHANSHHEYLLFQFMSRHSDHNRTHAVFHVVEIGGGLAQSGLPLDEVKLVFRRCHCRLKGVLQVLVSRFQIHIALSFQNAHFSTVGFAVESIFRNGCTGHNNRSSHRAAQADCP